MIDVAAVRNYLLPGIFSSRVPGVEVDAIVSYPAETLTIRAMRTDGTRNGSFTYTSQELLEGVHVTTFATQMKALIAEVEKA